MEWHTQRINNKWGTSSLSLRKTPLLTPKKIWINKIEKHEIFIYVYVHALFLLYINLLYTNI